MFYTLKRVSVIIAVFAMALRLFMPLSAVSAQSQDDIGEAQPTALLPHARNTYTTLYWPASATGYDRLQWNVKPLQSPNDHGFFYSHSFYHNNADGGYAGLQTRGYYNGVSESKIAIFSIWKPAIAVVSNGESYYFANEGEGYSARIKYDWKVNVSYTFSVKKTSVTPSNFRQKIGSYGSRGQWWGAWVKDNSTGISSMIGAILLPPTAGNLSDATIYWLERFSPTAASCSSFGYGAARYTNVILYKGTTAVQPKATVNSIQQVDSSCANSYIHYVSGGAEHHMGAYPQSSDVWFMTPNKGMQHGQDFATVIWKDAKVPTGKVPKVLVDGIQAKVVVRSESNRGNAMIIQLPVGKRTGLVPVVFDFGTYKVTKQGFYTYTPTL